MKIDKEKVKTHQEETKLPIPQPLTPLKYVQLLRYATPQDKFLMTIGVIAALGNGVSQPLFAVIFGQMTDSFSSGDSDKILDEAGKNALYFVYVAIGAFVLSFIMFSTWITSGEKQSIKIRKAYFQAILKQEVGWFDLVNPNTLNSKVADETSSVQEAIQEKATTFITTLSTFACGFIIGYIRGWQLALVITASMPVLATSVVVVTAVVMKSIQVTTKSHSEANAVAEQALNAIKTVKMLDGENFECERYYDLLIKAARITVEYSLYQGLCTGLIFGCLIWTYALGFYYGSKLISTETINSNTGEIYTAGDVMTIFFAILMGSFSLGQAGPCFQSFGKGKVAGAEIFQIVDRDPKIKSPVNPKSVKFSGEIKFQNVSFNYPTREEVQVLNNISFSIQPGQKVALVGESGCGKSTIIQLVERFYDTLHGQILIGEEQIDIRDLNLTDYRSQIGLVGQEPVLFAGSIKENLLYGKPTATNDELIDALKRVNAYDFVMKMDKKMDTYIGIGGNQISGGQKQRIAIARAILKKPKLLLLDEATSALDRTNEILIQKTLDQISQNITTIVIAHRLSTIQNADVIYVFDKGQIVEFGTHQELISRGGKYEALAKNQMMQPEQKKQKQMSLDTTIKERAQSISSINELNQFQQDIVQNIQTEYKESIALIAPQQQDFQKIMFRLFKYNREERGYFISGLLAAILNGSIFPLFSLFLSEMITVLLQSNPKFFDQEDRYSKSVEVQDKADKICLYFFLFGLAYLLFQSLESVLLQIVAEFLTVKLRYDTFKKLLRMPIPFFDKAENNAGTLTARLSVDCKTIQGLTSTIIGFKVQNASSLMTGMAIAFSSSWALTLVALATAPISFLGRRLRQKHMSAFGKQADGAYKDSGNLIMEAVTNIRTVYSFGNEDIILNAYNKKIQQPENTAAEQGIKAGLAFGFSQMQTFLVNALIFYMGAILIKYQGLSVLGMFRAIFGITFATLGAARDSHFAGDADKGQQAAINLFGILDSTDEFQIEEASDSKRLIKDLKGEITFENVGFKYDTRDKNLFENLNLHIPPGAKVSLVGPSGCGKSSIMQILMRFYNITSGRILLDGENIMDYDIRSLRKQLAIVSQEPVLFNGSIADNIRYNQPNISMEQIIDVSKQANAYNFIMSDDDNFEDQGQNFGKGFDKQVGPKGSKVSGGQKQRIAIARALLRQQNILLLDEATSALDSLSEQLVQETLDQIMKNRTTIAIAHRFSTIKDSEIIYVFDSGKIVEQGKYDELMQMNGCFYRLAQGIAK